MTVSGFVFHDSYPDFVHLSGDALFVLAFIYCALCECFVFVINSPVYLL